MNEEQQRVYSPSDVAKRFGISVAGLRRLALSYERVFGELPRDERGRVWPEDAIERLDNARAVVREGRAPSVEAAMRNIEAPSAPIVPEEAITQELAPELLMRELRALREAIEVIGRSVEELAEENRRLRAVLEAPSEPQESPVTASETEAKGEVPQDQAEAEIRKSWWRRLLGG